MKTLTDIASSKKKTVGAEGLLAGVSRWTPSAVPQGKRVSKRNNKS